MNDELTLIQGIAIGILLAYLIYTSTRKRWYLETMHPRQQYHIGKEKKLITNMVIKEKTFNGFEAGKYKVILLYGDIATFSKSILHGKLEEMYMEVLTKSLMERRLLTRIERMRLFSFIYRRIPALTSKAYLITGELVSPQYVLDFYWKDDEEARNEALAEMRRRRLIDPKVLWIKPYPPEDKLKKIMTGVLMVPDIILNHEKEYEELTSTQRSTLIEMDRGIASTLREVIQLERDIVTSISDPFYVLAMIISDRARKIEGIGIEQIAEKGGLPSVIRAAEMIREHKEKLLKALGEKVKPEEVAKVGEILKRIAEVEKRLQKFEGKLEVKPKAAT